MISLSNSKINLGLEIKEQREDGYHNIESIFLPLPFGDVIECIDSSSDELFTYGLALDFPREENLLWKGWKYMKERYDLPTIAWHLYKQVPPGTGIGAGSGNLGAMLLAVNTKFELGLTQQELCDIAMNFGSDTGFFVYSSPCLVQGRGEKITEVANPLEGKYLYLFKPESLSIRTSEAFAKAKGKSQNQPFQEVLAGDSLFTSLSNDFEHYFADIHPKYNHYKKSFLSMGASYVSLSGSGSCFYVVFDSEPRELKISEELLLLWYGKL